MASTFEYTSAQQAAKQSSVEVRGTPQQNRHQQGLGLSPEKVDASSVSLPFWDCHLESCDRPPATHCGGLFPRAKPFQSATPSPWWRTHNLRKSADGHLSADFRGDFGGKPGKPPGFFPMFLPSNFWRLLYKMFPQTNSWNLRHQQRHAT